MTQRNFRPTEDDEKLIKALMEKLGLNFVSVIRLAIRRLAEQEGINRD